MPSPIQIDYYTDPLCSWCYAAEPTLDAIQTRFGARIAIRYRLFPLFEDVREVMRDPCRLWSIADRYRIVSKKTGTPINPAVWRDDPPQSAWPPCEAVKAAERQGDAGPFLKRLRIGVMVEGRNIARRDVQLACAEAVGLDVAQFETDLRDPKLKEAVQDDIDEARRENVASRPHFIFANTQEDRVVIAGPRDIALFVAAIESLYHEQPEI